MIEWKYGATWDSSGAVRTIEPLSPDEWDEVMAESLERKPPRGYVGYSDLAIMAAFDLAYRVNPWLTMNKPFAKGYGKSFGKYQLNQFKAIATADYELFKASSIWSDEYEERFDNAVRQTMHRDGSD